MKTKSTHTLEIPFSVLLRALRTEIDFPDGRWTLRFNRGNHDQGLQPSNYRDDESCGTLVWETDTDQGENP